jgi:hypothetical protein
MHTVKHEIGSGEKILQKNGSPEADGWTIVDSALDPAGGLALISAQREAYSLVVMYDPGNPSPYWSKGTYTGAYMKASVRRARAPQFPEFERFPPGQLSGRFSSIYWTDYDQFSLKSQPALHG